jgi:molybdopterin-guanine dinucleotide biosynthesis protein A
MGRDKALLPWAGGDLLGHALDRLREVVPEVRILAGSERRYVERGFPVDTDAVPGLGPIAGLLAGLEAVAGRAALLLAIDLPLVPTALLSRLLGLAAAFDAVVPVSPRGPEPLCALYGPGCLPALRRRVERGDLRMTGFWPDVRVRRLEAEEVAAFGPPERLFLNVNAPQDYAAAVGPR